MVAQKASAVITSTYGLHRGEPAAPSRSRLGRRALSTSSAAASRWRPKASSSSRFPKRRVLSQSACAPPHVARSLPPLVLPSQTVPCRSRKPEGRSFERREAETASS